jgi:uncharacterized membrane protein YccC
LPLWTVLTAVILTQVTFGRSVEATLDYLAGTVGGAIYAGAVSLLIPRANDFSLAVILAIVVGLWTSWEPSCRASALLLSPAGW